MSDNNADFRVWLATPEAAERLDVTRLSAEEAVIWRQKQTARRRRDWASSRALLSAVVVAGPHSSSLTHSHGFAGLLRAPLSVAVGIDIEPVRPRDFASMAQLAFTTLESDHIASLDAATRGVKFYEVWTLKEAFAKALGLPLTQALSTCRCLDDCGQLNPSIPTSRYWRAAVFAPRPDLRLAVALVADSLEQLQRPIHGHEWPVPAANPWPALMDRVGIPAHLRCAAGGLTFP